jgi:membrane associated rhomboid family serine protease
MIFPFLNGLVWPVKAPFTYFLLAINLLVFVGTYDAFYEADTKMDDYLADTQFISFQGTLFADMIFKSPPGHYSATLKKVAEQVRNADPEAKRMLGNLALRNVDFVLGAPAFEFSGDQIARDEWLKKFSALRELQAEHPSFQWGVSQDHVSWTQWLTYQFAHSGFAHLFWNMVFLMIFGCMVETSLGGSFVVLTYVGAGVAGAYAFSKMSGFSISPLVGASAAVSGLMGLVAFAWWNTKGVNFFYWLLPIQGYFGFRLLPSWLVLLVSVVPDLSGYLSSSADFGSIAHSAHLGGTAFGGIIAFALSRGWMVREVDASFDKPGDANVKRAA